jgi:hypothetical protein
MREGHSYITAIFRGKRTNYNIYVKLDVIYHNQRGECAIGITHATQIPDMMIHTTLKSAQVVETKAVKPLKGENYTPQL